MGIINKVKKDILILFLVLIIVFIVTYSLETASALDEFIDNYHSETYVDIKDDIVRNPSLNAMELETYSGAEENAIMDIWTTGGYTEVDAGVNHLKNINGTSIWFDNVDRDEGDRIYKDFGANYYDVSFHYHFRVKISISHNNNARCYFMIVSEDSNDITGTIASGHDYIGFYIQWQDIGSQWSLWLHMRDSDVPVTLSDNVNQATGLTMNHWYHVVYIRNGDNVTGWFYNDALMTDLDFILTVELANVDNLAYFHPLNSQDQATGNRAMDLWLNRVCNVTISTLYRNNGYFITTDLLSSINGSSIVILLNTSIPDNDIMTIEFSSDGNNWTDHNGNVGSDTVIEGFEAIDVRDLFYSTFHTRLNYTDVGVDSTPRLYQIRMVSSAIGDGEVTTTLIIIPLIVVGLMIGLIIGLLIKR